MDGYCGACRRNVCSEPAVIPIEEGPDYLRCLRVSIQYLVLPLTYLVTEPAENINLVFGLGKEPQTFMHPLLYLALEMILLPLVICLPMHLLLQRLVGHR